MKKIENPQPPEPRRGGLSAEERKRRDDRVRDYQLGLKPFVLQPGQTRLGGAKHFNVVVEREGGQWGVSLYEARTRRMFKRFGSRDEALANGEMLVRVMRARGWELPDNLKRADDA